MGRKLKRIATNFDVSRVFFAKVEFRTFLYFLIRKSVEKGKYIRIMQLCSMNFICH